MAYAHVGTIESFNILEEMLFNNPSAPGPLVSILAIIIIVYIYYMIWF